MLTVFIATFVIFALVILGMSLGYLVKRKSIQGSCGGISALGLENPARHFLDHAKVALNDGATFGAVYGQFVRINLAANPDLIDRAITRMADSL